jgi:nucleotide-binding universal stress UspA family protein
MYKHILIPTDGSERSARAVAQGMVWLRLSKRA